MEILTHWEMTLKVLRILLSEELEMEAGYGEGEIVQSFRLLNWSLVLLFLEKLVDYL